MSSSSAKGGPVWPLGRECKVVLVLMNSDEFQFDRISKVALVFARSKVVFTFADGTTDSWTWAIGPAPRSTDMAGSGSYGNTLVMTLDSDSSKDYSFVNKSGDSLIIGTYNLD